jgi:hypothetical protein
MKKTFHQGVAGYNLHLAVNIFTLYMTSQGELRQKFQENDYLLCTFDLTKETLEEQTEKP